MSSAVDTSGQWTSQHTFDAFNVACAEHEEECWTDISPWMIDCSVPLNYFYQQEARLARWHRKEIDAICNENGSDANDLDVALKEAVENAVFNVNYNND
jgi:hypothetical protein